MESVGMDSDASCSSGKERLNKSLRSIVMSRTAFLLFHAFNPSDSGAFALERILSPAEEKNRPEKIPNFMKNPVDKDVLQTVVRAVENSAKPTVEATQNLSPPSKPNLLARHMGKTAPAAPKREGRWERKEPKITAALSEKLHELGQQNNTKRKFIVKNELGLGVESTGNPPRLDIAFGRETEGSDKRPLMAFCEAGFLKKGIAKKSRAASIDNLFWEKMDQSCKYLDLLIDDNLKLNDARFEYTDEPLLLSVLVASRELDFGRLAVFVCEPHKGEKGKREESYWRMALLWRKELYSEEHISTAFGGFVASVRYFADYGPRLEQTDQIWHYMGPNCCSVSLNGSEETSHVLRAYDNRVRQTSRSPFVYKEWKMIKNVRVVLNIKDEVEGGDRNLIEFRDPKIFGQSFLFRDAGLGGKVEVIAVPFIPGRHSYSKATQALSMVEWLESLHRDGYVHGDIRAFNMVFGERSQLIDYDFGGKEGDVTYPPGYKQDLRDGRRSGKVGEKISQSHDVKALGFVLGFLHSVYGIQKATSLAEMKDHLNNPNIQDVAIVLDEGFAGVIEDATKKEDGIDETEEGAA